MALISMKTTITGEKKDGSCFWNKKYYRIKLGVRYFNTSRNECANEMNT